jgi:serine O-acetyltransferase
MNNLLHDTGIELDLSSIVDMLCSSNGSTGLLRKLTSQNGQLPHRDEIVHIIEKLRWILFPGYFGNTEPSADNIRFYVGATLDQIQLELCEQIRRGFCFECGKLGIGCPECANKARTITNSFIRRLPAIQGQLTLDIQAAYEGDPAARSPDETIFCYPGVQAITYYRLAHELFQSGVPIIPRIITEHAHSVTGIDIHPGAKIGRYFFIDHGTGVVIGETSILGDRVRMYQGVTLGAKSFPLGKDGNPIKGIDRHPIIEDDVIIYAGATILGRVVIGRGSVIGGNVWITRDIPAGSRIVQKSAKHEKFEEGAGI